MGAAPRPSAESTSSWPRALAEYNGPRLSRAAATCPSWSHSEGMNRLLLAMRNPEGGINLGLAENLVSAVDYIQYHRQSFERSFDTLSLGYGDGISGSTRLQGALAHLFNRYFEPIKQVRLEQVIIGNGVSTVLDVLTGVLLNPGEGIMMSAPYYPGFDACLVQRSRARIVPVNFEDPLDALKVTCIRRFEEEIGRCRTAGITVRAIMIVNPHNPTGRCLPRSTLLAMAKFAQKHDLHIISNEIYGLSTFYNPRCDTAERFQSMLAIDFSREIGPDFDCRRLHVVYGVSKDFGMNGFRVGCSVSPCNDLVTRALIHQAFLMKVSSVSDVLVTSLLSDQDSLGLFVEKNRSLLAERAASFSTWCRSRGLVVIEPNASPFMLVYLGGKTTIATFDDEAAFKARCAAQGVYMSTGSSYHMSEPGWVRLTFALPEDLLAEGLRRLEIAFI